MPIVKHLSPEELEAGLEVIRQAPKVAGILEMIVCRPAINQREVLEQGELTFEDGLVGDTWATRGARSTPDGSADPEMQLNIMNARAVALVAQDKERWPLAGDQLYLDMDISEENLPAGTRLTVGSAIIEVMPPPHTGCRKFTDRFGLAAMKFVNSPLGRKLRLRGLNARVIQPGSIRVGDVVQKA